MAYDTKGHKFKNIGWNTFVCTRCHIGVFELEDDHANIMIPCPGHAMYACPLQGNAHTHDSCRLLFPTSQAAQEHWRTAHRPLALP